MRKTMKVAVGIMAGQFALGVFGAIYGLISQDYLFAGALAVIAVIAGATAVALLS